MFGQNDNQQSRSMMGTPTQFTPSPALDSDAINTPGQDLGFVTPTVATPSDVPDTSSPVGTAPDLSTPELPSTGTPDPMAPASDNQQSSDQHGDLLDLKQQALQHLSPLVSHLDQTPEEKFRTTMMMIQASDDHNLIKEAFEAAQQITDDKARAQALLDVINEINYFTQNSPSDN